jgi:hypothetical protein
MNKPWIEFSQQRKVFWKTLEILRKHQTEDLKVYPDMFGHDTYQVDLNSKNFIEFLMYGAFR